MKRMKKKIIIGLASCTMLAAAATFINSNNSNTMSAMALANVNALTNKEEFIFDGTVWNETDTHSWGTHWLPVLKDCTITIGFDFILQIAITTDGKAVFCSDGPGNCFNGSGCI